MQGIKLNCTKKNTAWIKLIIKSTTALRVQTVLVQAVV